MKKDVGVFLYDPDFSYASGWRIAHYDRVLRIRNINYLQCIATWIVGSVHCIADIGVVACDIDTTIRCWNRNIADQQRTVRVTDIDYSQSRAIGEIRALIDDLYPVACILDDEARAKVRRI